MATLQDIIRRALAAAQERLPEYTWAQGSENRIRLELAALGHWLIENKVEEQSAELLPTTASITGLTAWGEVLTVPRKPATVSYGANALQVTGTIGSMAPIGATLVHGPTGLRYQLTEAAVIPPIGIINVSVQSIDTGSATRLSSGETLTFESPAAGINADAVLEVDLDQGGEDIEPVEEYRARILLRFVESGALITDSDHVTFLLRQPNVVQAYAYPLRAGVGSVDLVALYRGYGAERVLPEADRLAIELLINAARPVGIYAPYRLLKVVSLARDVVITLRARTDSAWDWGDASPLTVQSYTAASRTIQFTAPIPDTLRAGDRLVIDDVLDLNFGDIYVVESVPSSTQVVLTTAPFPPPQVNDLVYAAGSLTQTARDAVLDYFRALGPANGLYSSEAWDDSVTANKLESAILAALPDVRDCTLVSADSTPVDPPTNFSDDYVELLRPLRVLVRRA